MQSSSGAGVQYEVEAEAEEERREITAQKEEYERRVAAAKQEEERLVKERENAGVTWGISEFNTKITTTVSFIISQTNPPPLSNLVVYLMESNFKLPLSLYFW